MQPDDARHALEQFLSRELPQALPLATYQPFELPAIVSFEPDADLGRPPEQVLHLTAERVARVFEIVFGPEDRGWVCVVQHGALQAVLPEPLGLEDVMTDGRVDVEAFVPQPVRRPDPDGLSVLLDALPPAARELVSVRQGHTPLTDPAFDGLTDEEGVPYVDVVVRVRPRDLDYRSLIQAVVNQDFPQEGRTRLVACLYVVNEDRPALLDLPDDRWFGVAMPDVEALRAVYECGLAPLNAHRRPEMERAFGSWPEPDPPSPAPRRPWWTGGHLLRRPFGR